MRRDGAFSVTDVTWISPCASRIGKIYTKSSWTKSVLVLFFLFRSLLLILAFCAFFVLPINSVLTLIPSVALLVALAPRLHKILGKGRLEGVRAGVVFYLKMLTLLAALGVQCALMAQIVSTTDYSYSSVLSTAFYILSLVSLLISYHD